MKAILIATASLVAACSAATDATSPKAAQTTEAPARWVEADYTKPGPPLSLAYQEVERVSVGGVPEVTLRVGDLAPGSVVEIDLSATPGLDVLGTSRRLVQADARGVATFTVDVRGIADGRHYLNVFAGTGEMGKRIVTVPVSVGTGISASKPAGELAHDGEGNAIVVMEAVETVNGVPN